MISATQNVKKILYGSSTVKIGIGCLLEYNMNNMIDNITVEYGDSLTYPSIDGINVYKKLFPVDSIIKPFRPINSGVKYYIMLNGDITSTYDSTTKQSFFNYKDLEYASFTKPRMYYSGLVNKYKYWVSPPSTDSTQYPANVKVKYVQSSSQILSAYSTGPGTESTSNRVIYKTTKPHGLTSNLKLTISGFTNTGFNLTDKSIVILSDTEFYITDSMASASEDGGGARSFQIVSGSPAAAAKTKAALANKIVIRFEKYHYIPTSSTVTITYATGISPSPIVVSSSSYSNGTLTLYWDGTSWSTTAPYSSSQPISWAAPKDIESIQVVTSNAPSGRLIAITEISARWVKDISSDLQSMNIQKEASSSSEEILPVGTITANSLQLNLSKYNQDSVRIMQYNREEAWSTSPAPNDIIYMYKDVSVIPHFIIYSDNGSITDGSIKYDRLEQGTFYIGDYSIETYGDTVINAFDGAKYLMQVIPTNLYLEDCPVTSAIMCLLDSVGFTNYNITLASNDDDSIPKLTAWWTGQESKMVWDHLQELCRDAQINAFFDEDNILQFYSRNYIYSKTNVDWKFFHSSGDSIVLGSGLTEETVPVLPNIVEFSKKEIPSANQVSIIWAPPITSIYNQELAENLWSSPTSYIFAGALQTNISATDEPEKIIFKLSSGAGEFPILSTFNFSGYFLVNSEILEYDAIEYTYRKLSDGKTYTEWIDSKSQLDSIRSKSYQDPTTFYPTGKYRIKDRGVFNTKRVSHTAAPSQITNWTIKEYEWDQGK
jgi:hypothetical protein